MNYDGSYVDKVNKCIRFLHVGKLFWTNVHLTQYKPISFNKNQIKIVVKPEKLLIRVYFLGVHVFRATFTSNSFLKKQKNKEIWNLLWFHT